MSIIGGNIGHSDQTRKRFYLKLFWFFVFLVFQLFGFAASFVLCFLSLVGMLIRNYA